MKNLYELRYFLDGGSNMHNALTRTKFTYSTKLTYSENPDKWYR